MEDAIHLPSKKFIRVGYRMIHRSAMSASSTNLFLQLSFLADKQVVNDITLMIIIRAASRQLSSIVSIPEVMCAGGP